jgi:hypothetical protein
MKSSINFEKKWLMDNLGLRSLNLRPFSLIINVFSTFSPKLDGR